MQQVEYSEDNTGIDILLAGEQRYNDTYNANALIEGFGHELRYNKSLGWLVYDRARWVADSEDEVMERAKQTIQQICIRALNERVPSAREALLKHVNRSLNYDNLRSMVATAKSDPRIRVRVEDFDRNSMLFNVQNGTIDLETGLLREHRAADYITQLAPFDYTLDAHSEEWERFILRVADSREDLCDYLQKALGYSLTGLTGEKVFFYAYGSGNNGKSTLLEAVKYAMGDYADAVPIETIISKGGVSGDQTRDNVALVGKRFIIAIEPDAGQTFRMGRIKQLTGGDSLPAKPLYKEQFSFIPQLKLWVGGNNKPNVPDSGNAAWERIRLIPFDARISEAEKDSGMPDKLRKAAPAILAWLVEGCKAWKAAGKLEPPACMLEAVQDYRSEEDPFQAYIDECCTVDGDATVSIKDLLEAYRSWRREEPDAPELSQKTMRPQVEGHGFKTRRTSGWHVLGLRLRSAEREVDLDEDDRDDCFNSNPRINPNWRAALPHQPIRHNAELGF